MVVVGQNVSSVLKPEDVPTDPNREYQGFILAMHGSQIKVQLTDPAYDGMRHGSRPHKYASVRAKWRAKRLDSRGFHWT
jgi:exoribonuclease R